MKKDSKVLAFHNKFPWILGATTTILLLGLYKIVFDGNLATGIPMLLISGPYPIIILVLWFLTMRS
jgi:hypothetical protein